MAIRCRLTLMIEAARKTVRPRTRPTKREAIERIEKSIAQYGRRTAHDLINAARYDALLAVDDREAASTHADQELDQFLSERMDGAR